MPGLRLPLPRWLGTGPYCLSGTLFYVLALYLCRYCTCMYFLPIVCRTDLQFIHRKCIYYSWISQSAWPDTNVERTVLFNNYSLSELSNQLFISISVSSFSLSALFCGGRVVECRRVRDVWRCFRKRLVALFHVLRIYILRSKTNCHHVTTWNIIACPCKDLH